MFFWTINGGDYNNLSQVSINILHNVIDINDKKEYNEIINTRNQGGSKRMKRIKLFIGSFVALAVIAVAGHSLAVNAATDNRRNCGASAIVKCGTFNQSEMNAAKKDAKALYSKYGISTNLSKAKTGTLKANGDVVVDGKVVATNAYTFGRVKHTGSVKVSAGGTTFYKHSTKVSFPNDTTIFVFFNSDGTFKAAIAKVCGNPILATPKPKPSYACTSLTAAVIDRNSYKFTTKASAKNGASIKDYTYDFGDGSKKTTGATVSHDYAKAGTYTVKVTVNVTVDGKKVSGPSCTTKVTVKPAPAYLCSLLTAKAIDRDSFTFDAKATATNGAKIKDYTYNFGDGTTKTTGASVSHTYAKAGTYTATVKANITVDGATKTVTGPNCQVKVTVAEEPVYACTSLRAITTTDRNTYNFVTDAMAKNGAVIKDYTYDFGDGKTATTGASTSHTYAKEGNYTVKVTVNMTVNGKTQKVTSNACTAKVTIDKEMCEVPGKEHLPKDDPRCVEDKPSVSITKTVNGKEHVSVNVNDEFTYEITVKNTGNTALKNLKVTDPAPAGITMLSADKGVIANNEWSYTIAALAVGQSATFKITAKYPAYIAGNHVNTACVDTKEITPTHPELCDTASTETHEDFKVCELDTKTVITIDRSEFDETKHSTNLADCDDVVTPPETPKELPHTGIASTLGSLIGIGSLTGAAFAYNSSRRNIR